MVTMKDIAVRAGVSRTMVSYVLNNVKSNHVSAENRKKILAVAEELGYATDDLARAVRTGRDKVLGYVSYNLANDPVIPFITSTIAKTDYTLSLFELDDKLIDNCIKRRISGIIFHSSSEGLEEYFRKLKEASIMIATIGPVNSGLHFIHVDTNNSKAVFQGMEFLYNSGHREIVFAGGHCDNKATQERYFAYEKFMRLKKLNPERINITNHEFESSLKTFNNSLTKENHRPTAFFCLSSMISGLLFYFAAKKQLRIPEDISILGFGQNFSRHYLTHIDEQYDEMIAIIIPALLESIESGKQIKLNKKLDTKLLIGDSTEKI